MSALSFFAPAYLWALGFLSVILLLHFFKRRVVRRMDISTLRFFPAAAVSRSRVRKLIEFLLLLARLLLVIALILVFAGLHDTKNPLVALRDPQSAVYIWIDETVSMEYNEGGASLGERAVETVDSLIGVLPPSAEHYVFDHESGRFRKSGGERGAREFAGRFGAHGLEEAVEAFLSSSSSPDIFVVISDFQKGTTAAVDSLAQILLNNGNRVICVSTSPAKPYNYAVKVRGGGAVGGSVTAVVYAHGAALDTTFVELTMGQMRIGQKSVYCEADDSVIVTFDIPPTAQLPTAGAGAGAGAGGWGRVDLHVTDPISFDNRDYFTVSTDRTRSALIVGNVRRNRVIGAALRAAGAAFWEPVVIKEGSDLTYDDLNDADLVIVNSFYGRSRILESFITGAGADKGIIITFAPDREDDFGRAFAASAGLVRGALAVSNIENGTNPVLSDTNTALWRGFPALTSVSARVYKHVNALPGSALVRMGNGRTLASSVGSIGGQGTRQTSQNVNLILVASPLGITQANNICETGFFVPFIDRLGRHALTTRGQADVELLAGYQMRNPLSGLNRAGTLYDADAKIVANWSSQPYVKIDKPGAYTLVSTSGETENLAVSSRADESEMIFLRPSLLGAGDDNNGIYYYEHNDFLEQIGNLSNNVLSYWLWVILGIALCAEVFLWKKRK